MGNIIIQIVGFLMIWFAVNVGRTPESKIKIFSINWWIVFVLITLGVITTGYESTPN